jgi:hypothetical protein
VLWGGAAFAFVRRGVAFALAFVAVRVRVVPGGVTPPFPQRSARFGCIFFAWGGCGLLRLGRLQPLKKKGARLHRRDLGLRGLCAGCVVEGVGVGDLNGLVERLVRNDGALAAL